MHDQHAIVDDVSQGQVIEHALTSVVGLRAVLRQHLPEEAVWHIHGVGLVVPSRESHMTRKRHLPGQQCQQRLDGERASVDEVAVEDIGVRLAGQAVTIPKREQVEQLPMQVADDVDVRTWRHVHPLQRGLEGENVCGIPQQQSGLLPWQRPARAVQRHEVLREAPQVGALPQPGVAQYGQRIIASPSAQQRRPSNARRRVGAPL
mmetsp:Transcript_88600/g.255508  ORF Transcript_88600/g.255508 Transcript_88600/m.255508 type:complete len:205 (+) Transcript_88600:561-1175(+)